MPIRSGNHATIVLSIVITLFAAGFASAATIALFDFDDDVTGLQNVTTDPEFATTSVTDWTASLRDTTGDGMGDNVVGGLSTGSDNYFVRSNDGTPNTTDPTSSETFSYFTITVDGLAADEIVCLTNVSYAHFGTGIDAGDQFFSRVYTDLTGLTGPGDGIANQPAFDTNLTAADPAANVSEDLSGVAALQGLANGDSVTFYLYYGDDQAANGDIHRVDNFQVDGIVKRVPEPGFLACLIGLAVSLLTVSRRR